VGIELVLWNEKTTRSQTLEKRLREQVPNLLMRALLEKAGSKKA
jgi:hypothetical protein